MRVLSMARSASAGWRSIRWIRGEPRGDRGAAGAFEAVLDLVRQELGGLVEQAERDERSASRRTISSPRRPMGRNSLKSKNRASVSTSAGGSSARPSRNSASKARAVSSCSASVVGRSG